jgi:hypothetical protein
LFLLLATELYQACGVQRRSSARVGMVARLHLIFNPIRRRARTLS